ncbi:MAG: alpha/beta hydrolase family protein [Gemmataceae bacterium]
MGDYLTFVRARADALRASDAPPANRATWDARRISLRDSILAAVGPMPTEACPLAPQALGTLERDGYRVEALAFQSRPDVWVTASLYLPNNGPAKKPAVLAVHGHYAWARIDPGVQAYCVGLVKLGFVVLCVDAFGAGERHMEPARGTYHGALDGAALWPVGMTLLGVQLYDNRRAIDYLLTRQEVDGEKLGITGTSGGGNQSMYAGALDERIKCVVPACSVGNYRAYLHVACCVCEVLPGALTFTEEGDVLGLVAPRPLMVISATKDSIQFSPAEAAKSLGRAKQIYGLMGEPDRVRHVVIEGDHGYSQPMREAMYGWMTRWLKGEGDGRPLPEPKVTTDPPDALRAYPDPSKRPQPWLTAGMLAKREAQAILAENYAKPPAEAEEWESTATYARGQLRKLLGGLPGGKTPKAEGTTDLTLHPEPGLTISATLRRSSAAKAAACVVLHPDGRAAALAHPLAAALVEKGWTILAPTLRATGEAKLAKDGTRTAVDHNSAEYGVWLGRPLLGQWLADVQAALDHLADDSTIDRRRVFVAGFGAMGLAALVAAGVFDDRLAGCVAADAPPSFLTDGPYPNTMRMGVLAPRIVRAGDVPHLAALIAPRRLVLLGAAATRSAYEFTAAVYKAHNAAAKLTLIADPNWPLVATSL